MPVPSIQHTSDKPRVLGAIDEEQAYLDVVASRRHSLLTELAAQLDERADDRVSAARHDLLRRRRRALADADQGLVLGRIDSEDGTSRRIGRVGVPAADGGEPLVLDWRADAARPFYTATALEPEGVRRRRHIRTEGLRVTGVDDEDLAGDDPGDLVGEAALIAALDERRTGRMGSAVATLQREQDAIVRASADRPLVVQGGPGTGKTVVGLHRVAYLLFADPEIARRGVLLVGPSRRFLSYVEQVLPALGETAVVAATCQTLLPGVRPLRSESREVAEIKGRAAWWPALRRLVDGLLPAPSQLVLTLDGERYTVAEPRVRRALGSALAGDRSLHAARRHAFDALREWLVDAVVERSAQLVASVEHGLEDVLGTVDAALARSDDRGVRTAASSAAVDGELDEEDVEALRARVATDDGVAAALRAWWPARSVPEVLGNLLRDPATVRELVGLSEQEAATVVAESSAAPAPSDIALLDALTGFLGEPDGEDASGPGEDAEPFLADRAASDAWWTYGHVVVDEAQELSAMQWHMIKRRSPTSSITAVGDIDQTEAPHRHTGWQQAVEPVLGERWRLAELTICYRTPREVMALVGPVLEAAGSTNAPPRAVRSTGREPRVIAEQERDLGVPAHALVAELADRYPGGAVGVVVPPERQHELSAGANAVEVLTPGQAKGLEWDACVVVDPDGIARGPRGWNALYVALTRCTQELVLLEPR